MEGDEKGIKEQYVAQQELTKVIFHPDIVAAPDEGNNRQAPL